MPIQEHGNRKSNTDETPKSVDMARLESPDTFVSSYFTGLFKDLSAVKMAQVSIRSFLLLLSFPGAKGSPSCSVAF
jgi:hypothetical protein